MKIKKLKMQNFAQFTNFECEFNGNITRLVGINGSGKTTIGITAIWACLKGIAEKNKDGQLLGERFRFIGNAKKSADIELTLVDEIKNIEITVKNHITTTTNQITFSAPPEYKIDNNWLNNLLSIAFLSAKNFTQLNNKDQALLLGIDTSEYDKKIADLKQEYTIVNREYKTFGELQPVEKVELVNINELLEKKIKIHKEYSDKKDEITNYNNEVKDYNKKISDVEQKIIDNQNKIEKLQVEFLELQQEIRMDEKTIEEQREWINKNPKKEFKELPLIPNTEKFDTQIKSAELINAQAQDYKTYQEKLKQKECKKIELDGIIIKAKAEKDERLKYIKSFEFDFDELIVDEDGGLLLSGRPIKEPYFSKGELEIIVAKLYASKNPELKVRFIDDFELLDEQNQEKIIKELTAKGFQIITAEVGQQTTKDNSILLRECKIVNSDKNNLF